MTLVKVCGLRSVSEARVALQAGANYLGFIFWKPGKRYIAPTDAAHIISTLRTESLDWSAVGVFVDPDPDAVADALIARGEIMSCAGSFVVEDPDLKPYLGEREGELSSVQGLPAQLTRELLERANAARLEERARVKTWFKAAFEEERKSAADGDSEAGRTLAKIRQETLDEMDEVVTFRRAVKNEIHKRRDVAHVVAELVDVEPFAVGPAAST